MAMTVVDWVFGQLLLGSWFDCVGLTLELLLVFHYFSLFGWKDAWYLKYAVVMVACVDVVSVIVVCEWVYIIGIKHWGEFDYLAKQGVQLPIHNILVSFTAYVTQGYLAWRFYRISKNMVVFLFLLAVSAAAYGSAIYISVVEVAAQSIADRTRVITAAYIWLSCEAACDIFVSTALAFYLMRMRKQTRFEDTRGVLMRLIFLALESGAFTSVIAIATLMSAALKLDSNVSLLFVFVLGRVYGCTFLYNLNIRKNVGSESSSSSSHGRFTGASGFGSKAGTHRVDTLHLHALSRAERSVAADLEYAGVNVERSTTVAIDTASQPEESEEKVRF